MPARQAQADRNMLLLTEQESLRQMENRPVYPYSVVPGGVKDARELKWAADHDPVVRAHYAGFDYDHARVVRLVLARTAYVSYRIGNKVYWTRHRVTLKKGETVITDGKITARSRCANRVEEVPQQATSSSEPPPAKFEEPVQPATGTAVATPPVPFESALLNRPGSAGIGTGSAVEYGMIRSETAHGFRFLRRRCPAFAVWERNQNGTSGRSGTGQEEEGRSLRRSVWGGEVPEPGTWLLVGSGLAAIYWKTRQRFAEA